MDWLRRLALILALLLAANGVSTPRLTEADTRLNTSGQSQVPPAPTGSGSAAASVALVYVRESPTPREPIAPQSLPTLLDAKAWALGQLGGQEYMCLWFVIDDESKWDVHAENPTSLAYGLPQAKPGDKMASAGADWRDNPLTQLQWAVTYGQQKYGGLCNALAFRDERGWW